MSASFEKYICVPFRTIFTRTPKKPAIQSNPRSLSNDCFESAQSSTKQIAKPEQTHPVSTNTNTTYIVHDPFTGEATATQIEPAARTEAEKQAILDEGWSRLDRAKTFEEKRQALNGILHGVEPNLDGQCLGVSRAIVERLATRKPAQMSQFSHLNRSLVLDDEYGLLSTRTDKKPNLSTPQYRSEYDGSTESEIYNGLRRITGTSWYRKFEGVRKDLHQSFLDEFDINSSGLKRYSSVKEIENAVRTAGNGALGYIFPEGHIIAVVNIKGDVFALSNCAGNAYAEALSNFNCGINENSKSLFYAITNQRVKALE